MFLAGVDIVRMNFSHGTAADHERRAQMVRETMPKDGRTVGIMGDLQGPKIRIGKFKEGKVMLNPGDAFVLDADCEVGENGRVGLDYKELAARRAGRRRTAPRRRQDRVRGRAGFGHQVHSRVRHGGVLSNNKGINRLGEASRLPPCRQGHGGHPHRGENQGRLPRRILPKSSADLYMARQLLRAAAGMLSSSQK